MKDWMKNIPGETLISEINLPGTHDSATRFCQYPYFSRCQELSIFEQLNIGVRLLDLRVEKNGSRLMLVHGASKCLKTASDKALLYLEDVLCDCESFLKAYPSETLVISIKCDHGDTSENTFDTLFEEYLNQDFWYKENCIPTLNEVRGKAVFLNRFCVDTDNNCYTDFNTGLNFSGWPDQGKYLGKTHLTSIMVRRDEAPGQPIFIQDWYKLSPKKKWRYAVQPTIEKVPCEAGVFLSFFSCGNLLHNPKKCSKYITKRFLKTELYPHEKYGWLLFDFPTEKVCRKVIMTNF